MTSKIFKSILCVAMVVLLLSLSVVTAMLYQYFGNLQEEQLKDELSLAAGATEKIGKSYLENLDFQRYRLTWVDADGEVLFDSHAEAGNMENHGNREEVQEALSFGLGSSTRKSATLTEQTIYEAIRLEDGSILRISVSRATAVALVLGMLHPIIIVLIIAVALSAFLAHRMAARVVEPLNRLNLEEPMENDAYEELTPLLKRIHAQQREIHRQMYTLQRKQSEFEQITGNMKEALVLLDDSGRVLSINPAAKTLFGAEHARVGEDFLNIERKQEMRQALHEAGEKGQAYFHAKKNGREYQFDVSRIDSAQGVHGLVILAFDVTEQMNAQKHRQEFTANVSHELKTPLQSIIGSAELMEHGIVKEEDAPRFIGHIRKEASRLVCLIDDIIRLSQLDEDVQMAREDVSLLALCREVCETLGDAARMKNVSLKVCGDDGVVHGAYRLLYEVAYNLCDNAIKYNRPGGTVVMEIEEKQGEVRLKVCDTGIGIAPEHQEKVFERFYRVDKSHSKQSGGTGLGLSIVKHAVQYHRGRISMQSEVDKGTEITVAFDVK